MFLPESFLTAACQPVASEILSRDEDVLQRLVAHTKKRFSGCLAVTVSGNQIQTWNLYFLNGSLVGSTGGVHPVRCWRRQIIRCCPQLNYRFFQSTLDSSQLWHYSELMQRVEQGQLLPSQIIAVVRGTLIETLFDFFQVCQVEDRTADIQLISYEFCQNIPPSPSVLVKSSHVLEQAIHTWSAWQRAGLATCSPNLAPVIRDAEALWQQTPPTAYNNLTRLIDGDRTLRDLAATLKQHVLLLTRSIMPYITQGILELVAVSDVTVASESGAVIAAQPLQFPPTRPLVAYLEDSQFDSMAMGQILRRAGYRFTSIRDPIQSLPWLLEQKPDFIFLDVLMPILSGYEVCARIRQISAFKHTPVVMVTSRDGTADRAQAKRVGASDFLAKPITPEKILATLKRHQLKAGNWGDERIQESGVRSQKSIGF
ncbi:MAG: response regulator [Cyanobacteria bacterium J06626_18]